MEIEEALNLIIEKLDTIIEMMSDNTDFTFMRRRK